MAVRKKFNWTDPRSPKWKTYRDIVSVPQIVSLLEEKIETVEQAESFFEAYREACRDAEHNLGYCANLIKDKDVREDVLDLFMIDAQTEPRQILDPEYRFSVVWTK
jgi:hypothetical protein